MADETARRYLFVAIDRATRWVYLRIYANQGEVSSTDFLRRLHAEAPMKIEKVLTVCVRSPHVARQLGLSVRGSTRSPARGFRCLDPWSWAAG